MLYLVWSIINRRRDNFRIRSSCQVLINNNQNNMNENLTCLDSHMNTNCKEHRQSPHQKRTQTLQNG